MTPELFEGILVGVVVLAVPCEVSSQDHLSEWRVTGTVLEVGTLEGPEAEMFARVVDAVPLPDGGLAVLEARAMELRVFDSDGKAITAVGGLGDGPGEFRGPLGLEFDGNALLTWDYGRNRLARWSINGELLDESRAETQATAHEGVLLYDGSLLIPKYEGGQEPRDEVTRLGAELLWYQDGDTISLGTFPYVPLYRTRRGQLYQVPFGGHSVAAGGGDTIQIYVGDSESGSVRYYREGGEAPRRLQLLDRREVLTDAVWAEAVEPRIGRSFGEEVDRRAYNEMPRPARTHWFEDLVVDRSGRLWATYRSLEGDLVATIYEAGFPIATIDLPDVARIFSINDELITALRRDELDVEHVMVLRYEISR